MSSRVNQFLNGDGGVNRAGFNSMIDEINVAIDNIETKTLTHLKSGAVHALTGDMPLTGIATVRFKATAYFIEFDSFTINGVLFAGQLTNGVPLDTDAFKIGAVVSCEVDLVGKVINFKLGGGIKLNVFKGVSPPTNKPNGIWLKENLQLDKIVIDQFTKSKGEWLESISSSPAGAKAVAKGIMYSVGISVKKYDVTNNVWVQAASSGLASFSQGQSAVGAVGDVVYSIGGNNEYSYCVKNNNAFDTATNLFSIKREMGTGRSEAASVVIGSLLYIIGGYTGTNGTLTSVTSNEVYDATTNLWSSKTPAPEAQMSLHGAVVGTVIHVLGGYLRANSHWAFDTVTNLWSYKAAPGTNARGRETAIASEGNLIFVTDGSDSTVFKAFDTTTSLWSILAPSPTANSDRYALNLNGVLYFFNAYSGVRAFSVHGDTHLAGTVVIKDGLSAKKNKTRLFNNKKIDIISYISQCYYHDGVDLRSVSSAVNIDDKGWTDII